MIKSNKYSVLTAEILYPKAETTNVQMEGCRTSKYFLLGGSPAFKYSVLYVPRTAYKDQA